MHHVPMPRGAPARALAAALVAATAVGGCGGDDGEAAPAGEPAGAERRIETVVEGLAVDYNEGDVEGFCAALSKEGRKEVELLGQALTGGTGCATVLARHVDRENRTGVRPFEIESVKVRGDRAAVMATGGIAGDDPAPLRLVRAGGDWKVVNPLTVSRIGADSDSNEGRGSL